MRKILQITVSGKREEQPMTHRVLAVKYPPSKAALRPPEAHYHRILFDENPHIAPSRSMGLMSPIVATTTYQ